MTGPGKMASKTVRACTLAVMERAEKGSGARVGGSNGIKRRISECMNIIVCNFG